MQRLNGMETSFLYLDMPAAPMQVAMCCLFDPGTVPGGYSFAAVRQRITERLELIPPFRRRVQFLPGHLHRPVWIDDPEFDLDQHLHRATLPAPGGPGELEQFVAAVIARPLDRRRPLWEMHIVDGLGDGTIAAVTKMHHATIDGVSAAELAVNLLDLDPDAPAMTGERPRYDPPPPPSSVRLLVDSARDLASQPVRAAATLAGTTAAALRIRNRKRRDVLAPPRLFTAPRICSNEALTPRRSVSFTSLRLDDVKAVRHATSTTVNDVVLAVCAGALRDHLRAYGGLPDRPLVAAIPVAVADAQQAGTPNQLSAMLVALATHLDQPLTRLAAIAASSRAAKDQHHQLGAQTLGRLAELAPPVLLGAVGAAQRALNGRTPPLCNLIISNFPGPPFPLYMAGAKMLAAYPLGPLGIGTGLNITVQSYLDTLWIGIAACPDTVPEPQRLSQRLASALHDLTASVSPVARPPATMVST